MSTSRFDLAGLRDRDELQAVGKDLAEEIKSDDVAVLAAAVSFKIVLALFPAMLAAVAIFAIVTNRPEQLNALLDSLPPEVRDVTAVFQDQLQEFIDRAASRGIAFAGIAGGLWAASGAAATLNTALSRAYDEPEDRKLVGKRAIALVVTVALLVALIAISVLLVAGGTIERNILANLTLTETARDALDVVSTGGRYLLAILVLMVLFAFIYWIGPDYERRPGYRWITPGAFVAVLVWLLASAAFGWYVSTFGSYTDADSPYGPLGSAIVFMLWLQLSMFALLLGAEINQVLVVRARERAAAAGGAAGGRDGSPSAGGSDKPVAERTGTRARASDPGAGPSSRARVATVTPDRDRSGAGSRPAGVIDVRRHRASARGGPAGDDAATGGAARSDGGVGPRPVPVPTFVGAAVAGVSSLIGLVGLLRRLKGE